MPAATSRSRSGIDADAALFGVLDGLGHGPDAAAAAMRAVEALKDAREQRVEVLVQLCHRVLGGTRGAAMTLARVDFAAGTLSWTGVGNVTANLVAKDATRCSDPFQRRGWPPASSATGYPDITPAQVVPIRTGDLLVIASDGIDRRSPGPYRLRRPGHGNSRGTSWLNTPRIPTTPWCSPHVTGGASK